MLELNSNDPGFVAAPVEGADAPVVAVPVADVPVVHESWEDKLKDGLERLEHAPSAFLAWVKSELEKLA